MVVHAAGVYFSHMSPVSAASQMSPVSAPCDVKSIDAEAIKPNWPVASHMSQLFTNQHTHHVRKSAGRRSAGQGCPAPVGQNQLARGVLYDTKVYQSIYSPRAILMLHGGTPAGGIVNTRSGASSRARNAWQGCQASVGVVGGDFFVHTWSGDHGRSIRTFHGLETGKIWQGMSPVSIR